MDPFELDHLLYTLASSQAETVSIPVEKLTPGCVLADGPWERHVVTARTTPRSRTLLQAPVRHLHGGHTVHRSFRRDGTVLIYRARLARPSSFSVPEVPRCFVPENPEHGDRIVRQNHTADRLGDGDAFHFDGAQWVRATTMSVANGSRSRPLVQTFSVRKLRAIVSDVHESSPYGWYTYLPAGHLPHLYVDGRPVPARTAAELAAGDVVLLPGGGRLLVEGNARAVDGTRTLTLRVEASSRHVMRHLVWGSAPGDVIEHHDSGRTRSLYAAQPRPQELVPACDLYPGDSVIASYGAPYSSVATVTDVWRQPVTTTMHVHADRVDGSHLRAQTGLENRFVVLRSARAAEHGYAPAGEPEMRMHA